MSTAKDEHGNGLTVQDLLEDVGHVRGVEMLDGADSAVSYFLASYVGEFDEEDFRHALYHYFRGAFEGLMHAAVIDTHKDLIVEVMADVRQMYEMGEFDDDEEDVFEDDDEDDDVIDIEPNPPRKTPSTRIAGPAKSSKKTAKATKTARKGSKR